MAKSAAELGATDDAVEKKVELAYTTWRAELVACIKEAQRDGTVDAKQTLRRWRARFSPSCAARRRCTRAAPSPHS